MLAISRSCLAKAFDLRSVTSPSLPKTSKLRLKTSFSSRCQLFTRPAGTTIKRPVQFAPARKFPQDQRRLDGLAQADFIGDQEPPRRRRGDPVGQHDLMRKQVDLGRREGGGALQQRQGVGLVRQPGPLRPALPGCGVDERSAPSG